MYTLVATEVLQTLHPGATGLCWSGMYTITIKVWQKRFRISRNRNTSWKGLNIEQCICSFWKHRVKPIRPTKRLFNATNKINDFPIWDRLSSPGIDVGGRGLSNLETNYFNTKHCSSLTQYTTANEIPVQKEIIKCTEAYKYDRPLSNFAQLFARLMAINLQLTPNPTYCACAEVELLKLHKA